MELDSIRFLRLPELMNLVQMSRTSIYSKLNKNSRRYDPTFPRPIKNGRRLIWVNREVELWMSNLIRNGRI